MRGADGTQKSLFTMANLADFVPPGHPRRGHSAAAEDECSPRIRDTTRRTSSLAVVPRLTPNSLRINFLPGSLRSRRSGAGPHRLATSPSLMRLLRRPGHPCLG